MATIRKAVIPAAGLGTRFLPATKAIPKEMLPIVDKPTIQYIVEEAVAAGLTEIVLVNGRGKSSIEDHFDVSYELEHTLRERGKAPLADELRAISKMVHVISVRQKEPLGLGHAVLAAREVVGDEPFAVLLGDDVFDCAEPAIGQLIRAYEKEQRAVIALLEVAPDEAQRYGVVAGTPAGPRLTRVTDMVEKPSPGTEPSRLAIMGRYVLPPSIWSILESTPPGKGGEIQLTDALKVLAGRGGVLGYQYEGTRYDAGDRVGYLTANVAYALKRPELREALRARLAELDLSPRR
jgi:UTP--glucose-1-phosphate uridylyltransferase